MLEGPSQASHKIGLEEARWIRIQAERVKFCIIWLHMEEFVDVFRTETASCKPFHSRA